MTLLQSILLGLLQGVTEFLPISSSGHLVLIETVFGLNVEDLKSFDVALHVASLLAILIYFRKTIIQILLKDRKYILWLITGTIPAVLVGFFFEDQIDRLFRGALMVGIVMVVTGGFFLIAEKYKPNQSSAITHKKSLLIGLAQAIAIIPGISRSGSTIATGLLSGMERTKAAEFSFLLGSIAITGAGILTAFKEENMDFIQTSFLVGFIVCVAVSYFSIKFLMKFFKTHTMKPFAYYLFLAGTLTIIFSLA